MRLRERTIAGLILIGTWGVSLALPAAIEKDVGGTAVLGGWEVLVIGWLGPTEWQYGWFANPLLLVSNLLSIGSATAMKRTFPALALLLFLAAADAATWTSIAAVDDAYFDAFGPGRLVWLAAIAGTIMTLLRRWRFDRHYPALG